MFLEDIELCYNEKIEQRNRKFNENRTGNVGASQTFSCIKKINHYIDGDARGANDMKSNRHLRLGNVMHEDIQSSFDTKFAHELMRKRLGNEYEVVIEKEIFAKSPINKAKFIVMHIDLMFISHEFKKIYIYDLKSAKAFKWKMLFGREKGNSDVNYLAQVGKYMSEVQKEYPEYRIFGSIIYYKKDDSDMKVVPVSNDMMYLSEQYWENVGKVLNENTPLLPGVTVGVPYQQWECNYCDYNHICKSPFIDPKKMKEEQ